jgi:ABC-type multidrug transport system ATPase subunit
MGVVTGHALVDGLPRDSTFQRRTGYATQQDLHLHTATVREALSFSALLRQPARYTWQEKLDYVEEVIKLVDLEDCADAVVGSLGEGLNVEQRKRLTIGVELAARPELLLFLDEPTSGLDSQTSWSICNLMEKLTKNGQAILCTIHQPSAALFQRFDRLLLLAKGGRTVYFGEVGPGSSVLVDYFRRNGAPDLKPGMNPAEYMLEVIGATPNAKNTDTDWPAVWRASPEYQEVQKELARLSEKAGTTPKSTDPTDRSEFAAGLPTQVALVTKRVFQQYWRTPSYIFSKAVLTAGSVSPQCFYIRLVDPPPPANMALQALFIGLSQVNAENTGRGLFNQMLGVYIFLVIFGKTIEQAMPMFVSQRTLYEARERPAKAYSWVAFLFGTITVEMAWNSVCYAGSEPSPPFLHHARHDDMGADNRPTRSWRSFPSSSGTTPWVSIATHSTRTQSTRAASPSCSMSGPSSSSRARSAT